MRQAAEAALGHVRIRGCASADGKAKAWYGGAREEVRAALAGKRELLRRAERAAKAGGGDGVRLRAAYTEARKEAASVVRRAKGVRQEKLVRAVEAAGVGSGEMWRALRGGARKRREVRPVEHPTTHARCVAAADVAEAHRDNLAALAAASSPAGEVGRAVTALVAELDAMHAREASNAEVMQAVKAAGHAPDKEARAPLERARSVVAINVEVDCEKRWRRRCASVATTRHRGRMVHRTGI
jgi:hypothetical protein